jgi:type VI secretion system protein ImpG
MRDELQLYYEKELTYLRQNGAEFAEKYPKIAARLQLESSKCEDPHVERLLEAFAFLAARVHLKIDDEFPEITEALLNVVYPHFIRPIPSMSVVQFQLDVEQGKLTTGWPIQKDTMLYSQPVGGVPCKFRTCYDTTLWPVSVTSVQWRTPDRLQPAMKASDAAAAIRVELRCGQDVKFPQLGLDTLRFYLNGESALVHTLYELLCCKLVRVVVRDPTPGSKIKPFTLPASCLRPVGFEAEEGMLPYPRRSFVAYRLVQELFTFPEKFLFLDINGLEEGWAASGFKDTAEIIFLLSDLGGEEHQERLTLGLSESTFQLGCAPIINLFPQTAEPILLHQRRYEYGLVPDVRRPNATEVFSIDSVASVDADTHETVRYEPFYSFHAADGAATGQCFWLANRRESQRANDSGTEMSISLVDLTGRPAHTETDTLTVRTTCTNRDLPARLSFGNNAGDFELEGNSPIKRIVCLRRPTAPLRPPLGKSALWHLISHLSLNHLSIVEEGHDALKQILKLYNFTESPFSERMIQGILSLKGKREFARVVSDNGISFARGWRVELELDEGQFVGGGVYLFASVIEQFLGLYASMNSFSQLVLRTPQRKGIMREWAPRAGRRILM